MGVTSSSVESVGSRARTRAFVALLRPHQWLKNGVVLAPLVFAHKLFDPDAVRLAGTALLAACALSAAAYALNDLLDRETDRLHPAKRLRPLAAGELGVADGVLVLVLCVGVGLGLCLAISPRMAALGVAYLALQYAYSAVLKRIVIVDVMAVAAGFILRAYMGGVAIGVAVSPWLVLLTFLLSSFLALARRRQELVELGAAAASHRPALADYSVPLLDQMISPLTAATLVAYMIYSVWPDVSEKLGTGHFHLTVPVVAYGMFRYLYLVHRRGEGDDPARLLLTDGPLRLCVVVWMAAVVVLLYGAA
jgi:4-hydroxybenzoate polyprenyltransferase